MLGRLGSARGAAETMLPPLASTNRQLSWVGLALLALGWLTVGAVAARPQTVPSDADLEKLKALSEKIEACGGNLGCITKLQGEIAAAAAGISKSSTMPVGTGWGAYRPCSAVLPSWCCLPVAATLSGTTEERIEQPPSGTPAVLPYYPGYTSHYTLFSWRAEGTGELSYRRDFSEFQLISEGTLERTEVLSMTGYTQRRDRERRIQRRVVPNQPVKPRNPYTLSLRYPPSSLPEEPGGGSTNLLVTPVEVESADDWLPTYRGSQLREDTPLKEPFVVTPAMMKGLVDAARLQKAFSWRHELDVGRPPPASYEDNRLELDLAFGQYRDRRKEETKDHYCPEAYQGRAAYDLKQDSHAGTLTVTMRIGLRRKAVVRERRVSTLSGPGGTIELNVSDVTVAGRPPEEVAIPLPELKRLREKWKAAIEAKWNNRFEIDCGCLERPLRVVFDVRLVDAGADHWVNVLPGDGRSDAENWYAGDPIGVAAHEFGHFLGLDDEYAEKDCPGRPARADGSIMNDWNGVPKARHFEPFARWLSDGGQKNCKVRPDGGRQ